MDYGRGSVVGQAHAGLFTDRLKDDLLRILITLIRNIDPMPR